MRLSDWDLPERMSRTLANHICLPHLCAGALLTIAGASHAQAQTQTQLVPFTNWMTFVGQQPGFTVTAGDAVQFSQSGGGAGCAPYVGTLGSCFGNNPLTPYILAQPPVGSANLPAWTQSSAFQGPAPYGATVNNFYQLSMNEAIVTVITLPPLGAYWSLQTYLLERSAQFYPTTPTSCPSPFSDAVGDHVSTPDCGYDVFGLFNNTINNAVVFNQFGQGFSDQNLSNPVAIAVITTPNAALYTALQQDFSAPRGTTPFGTASEIFSEAMPTAGTPLLHVGTQANSDVFASVIRYNIPKIAAEGNQWTSNPGMYINVYRVYASSITPTSYPTPTLYPQSYNTNECDLINAVCSVQRYQADVNELSNLLISYLAANSPDKYVSIQAKSSTFGGFNCITSGRYCQGGTQDTASYRIYNVGQLPAGGYAAMVGVFHSSSSPGTPTPPGAINNSVFTGVSWSDNTPGSFGIAENEGVGASAQQNETAAGFSTSPPGKLAGSASLVLNDTNMYNAASTQLKADLPNLYVVVLTRNVGQTCQIALCRTSAPYVNAILNASPPLGIPPSDVVSLTERAYLLPGVANPRLPSTALTGANADYLLSPNVMCDQSVNSCR